MYIFRENVTDVRRGTSSQSPRILSPVPKIYVRFFFNQIDVVVLSLLLYSSVRLTALGIILLSVREDSEGQSLIVS